MSLGKLLDTFRDEKIVVKEDKKYVEKDSGGVSLKGVLQRGRIKLGKDKKLRPRGLNFTPSTITYGYCRRAKIGQLAGLFTIWQDKFPPSQQTTFDLGHAIHDIFQGYFWDIGQLRGDFECLKCDKIYKDLLSPKVCPSGIESHKRKHLRYREVIAKNSHFLISGRCDGIIDIDGELHILDIKSIQNRTMSMSEMAFCFEDLDRNGPKADHIVQLTFYMWILEIHRGHLLYVGKNDGKIKSFAIPFNEALLTPYLQEIEWLQEQALKLKYGKIEELPPPCGDDKCSCHTILKKLNK